MTILTQNKETVVNYDGVTIISIFIRDSKYIIGATHVQNQVVTILGSYETKARALWVLKKLYAEIAKEHPSFDMPEDSDE